MSQLKHLNHKAFWVTLLFTIKNNPNKWLSLDLDYQYLIKLELIKDVVYLKDSEDNYYLDQYVTSKITIKGLWYIFIMMHQDPKDFRKFYYDE